MEISVRAYETYEQTEVLALYQSVGWSAYYKHPEALKEAFAKSLCVLAAYDGNRLVGLLRTVGDGVTVVFLQDILVHPGYQRRGIGRMLIAGIFSRYSHVRQLHLLTDDVAQTVGFYEAVGFTSVEDVHCRAFTRIRY